MYDFIKEEQNLIDQCDKKVNEIEKEEKISRYVQEYLKDTKENVKGDVAEWYKILNDRTKITEDKKDNLIKKKDKKTEELDGLNQE